MSSEANTSEIWKCPLSGDIWDLDELPSRVRTFHTEGHKPWTCYGVVSHWLCAFNPFVASPTPTPHPMSDLSLNYGNFVEDADLDTEPGGHGCLRISKRQQTFTQLSRYDFTGSVFVVVRQVHGCFWPATETLTYLVALLFWSLPGRWDEYTAVLFVMTYGHWNCLRSYPCALQLSFIKHFY